ncbi:MAG: agmatinase family protein [Deltaproteobacteria bacterium]|nr:agmatinase family protein [Deltaproteobacteria bacterium]
MTFDPNAAAQPGSGIFGLPHSVNDARVVLLPVPFDATTSYAKGAARGPAAILEASKQVDLFDIETGKPYEQGIAMVEYPKQVAEGLARWNRDAARLAQPIIDAAGAASTPRLKKALGQVNDLCGKVNSLVYLNAATLIRDGKLVATLGGDHATPYGAIQAHAEAFPKLGVLHIDAHADLRRAYEGFTWSHASVMFNVLENLPIQRLVQVGVRDFCEEEYELITGSKGRVITHFDPHLAAAKLHGVHWQQLCAYIIRDLPGDVYVSFDIDGLDPALCPHTGTPVPGGLCFHEANALLRSVVESGRRIVGFDLNEVAPGPDGSEWDANVGARLLYKMIGWALLSWEKKRK